jgi:hypothetical protein
MLADVPAAGVGAFQDYESHVLPLLARHDGTLERRLRSTDAQTEMHIVSFGSRAGYESYMADPQRKAERGQLEGIELRQRIVEVDEVSVE